MRYFWIAILLLCAAAAGAYVMRSSSAREAAPVEIPTSERQAAPASTKPVQPAPTALPTRPDSHPDTIAHETVQKPAATPEHIVLAPTRVSPAPSQAAPASSTPPSTSSTSTTPAPAPAPTPAAVPSSTSVPPPSASPTTPTAAVPPAPSSANASVPVLTPTASTPGTSSPAAPTAAAPAAPAAPAAASPTPAAPTTTPAAAAPVIATPAAPAASSPVTPAAAASKPTAPSTTPDPNTDPAGDLAALIGDPSATAVEAPKSAPATAPAPAPAPATNGPKLEPQPDGSTLVDGKYIIKGTGTKDDPYRVTWEMLVSAQDTYQPRLGRKQLPERIKMINGKWISISGYIAFPLMAQSADEMLMMLNQWDGCCIGVPPTPYDAIEVKLKTAAKGDDRLRTTGTLVGVLRVDPYLVKDWLVSLYVMDNGEVTQAAGNATPGQHAK